jgi:hypothetical protein
MFVSSRKPANPLQKRFGTTLAGLLKLRKENPDSGLISEEWRVEYIEPTYGQIKKLQDNNCRIYFRDERGTFYHVAGSDNLLHLHRVYL